MLDTIKTAFKKDPALRRGAGALEVVLYPGVQAILIYRVSHRLHKLGLPFIPRALSYLGRFLTGAEIHPAAKIGRNFFIDHATGVVVGETAEVGDDVILYQNVTLGATGWDKHDKGEKRHPTIGDNVIVGVGAAILGPVKVESNTKIGALAVIVDDIPEGSVVVCPKGRLRVVEGCYIRMREPCKACCEDPEYNI